MLCDLVNCVVKLFVCAVVGRQLDGIHFAMTFLSTWQKKQEGNSIELSGLNAKDCDVVVIGGGDTGCDCIATSLRQVRFKELILSYPLTHDKKCYNFSH